MRFEESPGSTGHDAGQHPGAAGETLPRQIAQQKIFRKRNVCKVEMAE